MPTLPIVTGTTGSFNLTITKEEMELTARRKRPPINGQIIQTIIVSRSVAFLH